MSPRRKTKRPAKPKACFNVTASYPLACDSKATVCQDGRIDLKASDARVMTAARKAVRRIPKFVDSGAGPFGPGTRKTPMRDLEFSVISLRRGLTRTEKTKLVRALRALGVTVTVFASECSLSPAPSTASGWRTRK